MAARETTTLIGGDTVGDPTDMTTAVRAMIALKRQTAAPDRLFTAGDDALDAGT